MGLKYADTNPVDRLRPQEPFFFVRAQDRFALSALAGYRDALVAEADRLTYDPVFVGDPVQNTIAETRAHLRKQARDVEALMAYFEAFQANHPEWVKTPD